jgi:hypothetical protein
MVLGGEEEVVLLAGMGLKWLFFVGVVDRATRLLGDVLINVLNK